MLPPISYWATSRSICPGRESLIAKGTRVPFIERAIRRRGSDALPCLLADSSDSFWRRHWHSMGKELDGSRRTSAISLMTENSIAVWVLGSSYEEKREI